MSVIKKIGKHITATIALMMLMLLSACGNIGSTTAVPTLGVSVTPTLSSIAAVPPTGSVGVIDRASLLAALKGAGVSTSEGGRIEQPFLSVAGQTTTVNGKAIQTFEYKDTAALEQDAAKISPDGQIPTMMITWVAQPHFYKAGRLLVIYPGSDAAVLTVLAKVLGEPFATGVAVSTVLPLREGSLYPLSEPVAVAATTARSRILWGLVVVGACLVVALVATWPLALHLTTDITLGNEQGAMVGLLSIWSLWWTANRVLQGFAGYWDAPFFYPNQGVFTYSEPEPLTGLIVAPLWSLGATPALVHNVALLIILTLNGVFAYLLARDLDVPRPAALGGGVAMVALPFVAKVYGVLNLTPVFGMLWTLDGLVRFGRSGRLRDGIWAGLGFATAYLTCQQYALIFAPFALAAGIVALAQLRYLGPAIAKLAAVGIGTGLVLLPIIWPTYQLHSELGFVRQDFVVEALSARAGDFLSRPNTASLPFPPPLLDDTAGLFPGFLVLGLAATGLVLGWQQGSARRWLGFLSGSVVAAVILAMGLRFNILGWSPFDTLRTFVPGYAELRSPFRFAVIMQLMLVILAAIGLAKLATKLRKVWAPLILTLGILMVGENLNVPVPLLAIPTTPQTAWSTWLKAQPEDTVLAHIPFPKGLGITDYEVEGWRMFWQIEHQHPIVNGYSGYFPPNYTDFQLAMAESFPRTDLLCELSLGLGANLLVVDKDWLVAHQPQMVGYSSFIKSVYQDANVTIYSLKMPEDACKPATKISR